MQVFGHGVQGRGRVERHQAQARKELEDGSKVTVVSWDHCFLGARNRTSDAEVETWRQSGSGDARWSDKVNLCSFDSEKGVDFPSCKKVVKMIVKDLDTLGYHRVVFRSANEPSILSLLRVVKLAWTGDVVQETSAAGDPQSNGAAESSVNVIKGHVRSIKQAVESASGVEVPADHDLLMWLVPYAASMHRRFAVGRYGKSAYERKCEKARRSSLGTVR